MVDSELVKEFMPLQTCYVTLRPVGDALLYELESRTTLRPLHVRQLVPRSSFLLELIMMYVRLGKTLAALGSRSFREETKEWERSLPDFVHELLDQESLDQLTKAVRSRLQDTGIPD